MVRVDSRFHATAESYIEMSRKLIEKAIAKGRISQTDRNLINEYIGEVVATKGISAGRRKKITIMLVGNRDYLECEYSTAGVVDVYAAIDRLESAKKADGTPRYKQNTIVDRVWMLKHFYLWLIDNEYSDIPKKKIRAIEVPHKDNHTVSAGQLLTADEVRRIIDAAENTRDRALISMLYEGAFRVGELGVLQWKNIEMTGYNLRVNTSEKTGKTRFIPMVVSRPYLAAWMNDYPKQIEPEDYVFVTLDNNHRQLNYAGVVKQIRRAAAAAGITKPVRPHLFRHSRITHLLQEGINETAVKLLCWGDVETNMIRTYQHLQNSDLEKSILELNGVVSPEVIEAEKVRGMKPQSCRRCGTVNAPTAKYCTTCGAALGERSIYEHEALAAEIIRIIQEQDPSILTEAAAIVQAEKNRGVS